MAAGGLHQREHRPSLDASNPTAAEVLGSGRGPRVRIGHRYGGRGPRRPVLVSPGLDGLTRSRCIRHEGHGGRGDVRFELRELVGGIFVPVLLEVPSGLSRASSKGRTWVRRAKRIAKRLGNTRFQWGAPCASCCIGTSTGASCRGSRRP